MLCIDSDIDLEAPGLKDLLADPEVVEEGDHDNEGSDFSEHETVPPASSDVDDIDDIFNSF